MSENRKPYLDQGLGSVGALATDPYGDFEEFVERMRINAEQAQLKKVAQTEAVVVYEKNQPNESE